MVLGLDAFHEELFEYTPHIRSLYNENISGNLESTTPPVTAPAWASFQSGKNQGKHGIYDFVQYDENGDVSFLDGMDLKAKTFYEHLDEHGYDCLLFNLPFSLPARIDGDVIPSWLDGDSADPYPRNLYDEYDISPPQYPELKGSRENKISAMKECFLHNGDQFLELVHANDHDFMFQLISVTDWLQHNGYKELQHSPDGSVAESAKDLLNEVDDYVASIERALNSEDELLLVSDHGFRVYDGNFYINDWLQREGYLEPGNTTLGSKGGEGNRNIYLGEIGQLLAKQEWLYPILRKLKNGAENILSVSFDYEEGIDIQGSVAYCLSKDECSIRVNVPLDTKEEAVVSQILEDISKEGGVRATESEDIYYGPFAEEAGDIIVQPKSHRVTRGPVGRVTTSEKIPYHDKSGMFIHVDDRRAATEVTDAHLFDIAPTLLSLVGLPIPEDMDGHPLEESCGSSHQFKGEEQYEPTFYSRTYDENEEVTDRLNDLGYL